MHRQRLHYQSYVIRVSKLNTKVIGYIKISRKGLVWFVGFYCISNLVGNLKSNILYTYSYQRHMICKCIVCG